MSIDKNYDLFIAFHGDLKKTSYITAERLYNHLINLGYNNIFLQPITNRFGAYADTHRIVQQSKLFLFVVNDDVPRTKGFLQRKNSKGNMRRIWQEVHAFRESSSYRDNFENTAKLYLCETIKSDSYDEYTLLDSMFNGQACLHEPDFSDVVEWLEQMLNNSTKKSNQHTNPITSIKNQTKAHKWNADLAVTWKNILPPSRPSLSEISIYKDILKKIKAKAQFPAYKALVLGTTNEFRKLLINEGFSVTVVDVSKSYHNEITKDMPINDEKEKVVFCDWLDLSNNSTIEANSYDVVFGDLAIGNVPPNNLEKFIDQINYVLKPNGLFLGKTIYEFNSKRYTQLDIDNIFNSFFSQERDTSEFYATTMYPLALFSTDNKHKVNFPTIYKNVEKAKEKFGEVDASFFDIYIGPNTSFKDKMKLDFFVYPIKDFLSCCLKYFSIADIKYGKDIYSKEFPLIILKKNDTNNTPYIGNIRQKLYHEIACLLQSTESKVMVEHWTQSISAQYFLANITVLLNAKNYKEFTAGIQNKILDYIRNNMHVIMDNRLNCHIDFYFDSKMILETIAKYPEFNSDSTIHEKTKNINKLSFEEKKNLNNSLDTPLKTNYIWGLLAYLTWFKTDNWPNDANKMVTETLFSLIQKGNVWQPQEAIWVSARICISIFPMFSSLSESYKSKLLEVVSHIIYTYDFDTHNWKNCAYSSEADTFALCLSVLLDYTTVISDEDLQADFKSVLRDILDFYILNNNILDTMEKFYIGEHKVTNAKNSIEDCKEINDDLSVLSALIKLIVHFEKSNTLENLELAEIEKAEDLLLNLINDFWTFFKKEIYSIEKYSKEYEYSLIPQIIHSLIVAIYKENFKRK